MAHLLDIVVVQYRCWFWTGRCQTGKILHSLLSINTSVSTETWVSKGLPYTLPGWLTTHWRKLSSPYRRVEEQLLHSSTPYLNKIYRHLLPAKHFCWLPVTFLDAFHSFFGYIYLLLCILSSLIFFLMFYTQVKMILSISYVPDTVSTVSDYFKQAPSTAFAFYLSNCPD